MGRRIGGLDETQRRLARREALLDAALEMFASRGYLASPIEVLCQQARVSTKSFYEVFESREACYLALMARSTDHLKAIVVNAASGGDEQTTTEGVLVALANAIADDPRHALVLFGRGAATTVEVEQVRRANRRWAAGFVAELWRGFAPEVQQPAGLVTGVVGGVFDIMADWVADLDAGTGGPAAAGSIAQDLHHRLHSFYWAARYGAQQLQG